jgi:hypothetical protein
MVSVFSRFNEASQDFSIDRQPLVGARSRAALGDDDRRAALAPLLQPFADDRLRFAALIAGRPIRIDVGGVDRTEAGLGEPIEQRERRGLVGGPAEHVGADHERRNAKVSMAEMARMHEAPLDRR